jgi:hypothetical protein
MSDNASGTTGREHATAKKPPAKTPPARTPPAPTAASSIQRAMADPLGASPDQILALQQTIGNRAVNKLLASAAAPSDPPSANSKPRLQFKLNVGPAGDQYEQEADRVASAVMRMSEPAAPLLDEETAGQVQRAVDEEAVDDLAQRQAARPEDGFEAGPEIEGRLAANQGGGQSLPGETRTFMEGRFGADFSGVRVHTGGEAAQLNRAMSAQAFTHGSDIYMGAGKYAPGTAAGKQLLAHELTHTIQQGAAPKLGVQRFMTSVRLREAAGREKKDWKLFGKTLKSMSGKYKAVLSALDIYNGSLPGVVVYSAYGTVAPFGPGKAGPILEKLENVRLAGEAYLEGHAEGDDRVPHIQAILDDIPGERDAINTIAANPEKYPNRSLAQAISMYRSSTEGQAVGKILAQVTTQLTEAGTPGLSGEGLGTAALGSYESEMKEITQGGQTPTSFSFRGATKASKQASAFVVTQGLNFFRSVLMPALGEALNTPDADAEIEIYNIPGGDTQPPSREAQDKLQDNIARLRGYYTNLAGVFKATTAGSIPMPIAAFCASLFDTAQKNGMDPNHAYLLVSSQIFLRMINPMFIAVIAVVPNGQQKAMMALSKLLQDDANNVRHGQKQVSMAAFADLDYREQIKAYVNAVIERGQGED